MSEFSDQWLALRAPADTAARSDLLVGRLAGLPVEANGALEILDLGCGTGANLRHLAPLLAAAGHARQRWTCVDHDPALLARLPTRTAEWADTAGCGCAQAGGVLHVHADTWSAQVSCKQSDLAAALGNLPLPRRGLVSASALLDLVSAHWLDALLGRCRAHDSALLFALSYDGRCTLAPAHPDDAGVVALVNRHQHTDKGFGSALGPDAAAAAEAGCLALGYRVETAFSDWDIGAEAPALQRALLTGWRNAAAAIAAVGELSTPRLDAWLTERLEQVATGALRLQVGHLDLLAVPQHSSRVVVVVPPNPEASAGESIEPRKSS